MKKLLIFLVLLTGCEESSKSKTDTWCFESDCHAGHACCNTKKVVNGMVLASCCHASHACGTKYGRVIVPVGDSPTLVEAQEAKAGLIIRR